MQVLFWKDSVIGAGSLLPRVLNTLAVVAWLSFGLRADDKSHLADTGPKLKIDIVESEGAIANTPLYLGREPIDEVETCTPPSTVSLPQQLPPLGQKITFTASCEGNMVTFTVSTTRAETPHFVVKSARAAVSEPTWIDPPPEVELPPVTLPSFGPIEPPELPPPDGLEPCPSNAPSAERLGLQRRFLRKARPGRLRVLPNSGLVEFSAGTDVYDLALTYTHCSAWGCRLGGHCAAWGCTLGGPSAGPIQIQLDRPFQCFWAPKDSTQPISISGSPLIEWLVTWK